MKSALQLLTFLGLCLCIAAIIIGCGSPGDGISDSLSSDSTRGAATIRGNISSFDTAKANFVPVEQKNQSLITQLASWISEALIPSAHARGQLEGIVVYLEGDSVNRDTVVGADGTFIFSELPAGTYQLRFEYQGEQVRYRGRSGQSPTITVEEGEIVDLLNIRISGGRANIGNIKRVRQHDDDDSDTD